MTVQKLGEEKNIELGGLRFVVTHRAFGEDGGPSIEVFGDVEGSQVQVLRFDCFRKAPHYHYDPKGKNVNKSLDPAEVGDVLDWSLEQIRAHIPEMLKTAGFDDLARTIDAQALTSGVEKVRDAVAAAAPKS